ncbi:microcin-processing peptidase 1 [Panacagrimonas perspica]|uniref:Microcin-processing peptidase 1 n=1 Tax=Panacagrimonas perspica TaxID=381431 RepID=A0A4R7NT71_9GAMM|nr:metalloprotease PmbA [Panacagrimonas perspica]TDU24263.1 microcin-processing peptidase 1 [Panacagrimonas perspica]THD04666.1 metalloprotease PmbA [Panacagrimonas perspica]
MNQTSKGASAAPLPTPADLQQVAARVLDMARGSGATQSEASLSYSKGYSVSVRSGAVESLEFQRDRSMGITVYFGHRKGNASTGDLSDAGLRACVEAAVTIARVTEEDPCSGLADASRMARDQPDLGLDHPWDLTPEQAIERARACEAAALAVDKRIEQSEGAGLSTSRGISVYANSHGFFGGRSGTQHSLSCAVVATDGQNMQRDYWWDGGRNASRMDSPESIGRRAGQRTIARLGAKPLSTRTAPVLFVPEMARGLFGHFVGAISGSALYRKATFLLDKMDQPVFSPMVQLEQQPFLMQASSSAAFDSEGVATSERRLVEDGVLRGWVLGSYSARKLGLETTGNAGGVFNLVVRPGELDQAALLAQMGEGFLVTELMGQGANGVTGDYSRGAAGFWIENGQIVAPVEGVTIAGNLLEMYKDIQALGGDVDARSGIRCGSVLIGRMTIAGEG